MLDINILPSSTQVPSEVSVAVVSSSDRWLQTQFFDPSQKRPVIPEHTVPLEPQSKVQKRVLKFNACIHTSQLWMDFLMVDG